MVVLFQLLIMFVGVAGTWGIMAKAQRPGWYALVPFLSTYELFKVAGRPGWVMLLLFVPLINLVVHGWMCVGLARRFGHGGAMAAAAFFGFGLLILGFDKSQYSDDSAAFAVQA